MGENLEANNNNNNNGVPNNPELNLFDLKYLEWATGGELYRVGPEPLKLPDELGTPIDRSTPPRFPPIQELQGVIGECSVPFEKQLSPTNVSESQARFLIPEALFDQYIKPFLNAEENQKLQKHRGTGIEVTVYDSQGKGFPMTFKKWSTTYHALTTTGWRTFSQEKQFVAYQDWVTIWVFHDNNSTSPKLCFCIIARRFQDINNLVL